MKEMPMLNAKLMAIACATLAMVALNPNAALAQDTASAIHIPLAGLDLASAAGRRALDLRIKIAAENLCNEATAATLLRPTKCINEAIESAQARRAWLIAERQAALLDRARTIPAPILTAQGAGATSTQ